MNNKAIHFIRNFSYTLLSNLISLIISVLVVLIVPKIVGVEEYGYWQLYMFYSAYVGFMQFGWNDGIYLRYGGSKYSDLDKSLFFSQFWMLALSQIIIASIIIMSSVYFVSEVNKQYIFIMVALCLIIMGVRVMLLFILQATNRIKEYAQITVIDKLMYVSILVVFLLLGVKEYKILILADLAGKFLSLIFSIYCCRDFVFSKISTFYFSFSETLENIRVGSKLMLANIASMLIIGIVKFGIEQTWGVSTFGKVSLTLSISNMMMVFINAVGIIMFPILRRTSQDKLLSIYSVMREVLMVTSLGMFILYYPIKTIMAAWLPQYAESLLYMALVFPIFIYEAKMALLINTYLKTLRREKFMLQVNIITMLISLIMTFIATKIFNNLDMAVANIVVLLAFRSVLSELYLTKELKLNVVKDILFEILLTVVFILSGWFVNSQYTILIYGVAYIAYLIVKKNDILNTMTSLKLLIKA